jgi:hypothetical protein
MWVTRKESATQVWGIFLTPGNLQPRAALDVSSGRLRDYVTGASEISPEIINLQLNSPPAPSSKVSQFPAHKVAPARNGKLLKC